jgi:hypothetical protein
VYVIYNAHPTDWASTGTALATYASRAAAQAACASTAACIGFKSSADGTQWRTFRGAARARVVSKVRVAGEAINAWVPEPSGG